MGWAIGYSNGRDIGYGVPATCDYPTCKKKIDRGVSYCCGDYRSDDGCWLYFCNRHLSYGDDTNGDTHQFCDVCLFNLEQGDDWKSYKPQYDAKPDRPIWIRWKLKHSSWKQWREENPEEVERLKASLTKHST